MKLKPPTIGKQPKFYYKMLETRDKTQSLTFNNKKMYEDSRNPKPFFSSQTQTLASISSAANKRAATKDQFEKGNDHRCLSPWPHFHNHRLKARAQLLVALEANKWQIL